MFELQPSCINNLVLVLSFFLSSNHLYEDCDWMDRLSVGSSDEDDWALVRSILLRAHTRRQCCELVSTGSHLECVEEPRISEDNKL